MQQIIVSGKNFRQNFPKYQHLVEKGISIIVVKRSKPIFRIEPVDVDFQNEITSSLLDYEDNHQDNFVSYDKLFPKS